MRSAFVVVNGRVMNSQALATLDHAACQQVPNGYYWLDTSTGIWGYAGNPAPQGHISDGCRQSRRQSLSARGMLYSPYDWVRWSVIWSCYASSMTTPRQPQSQP